MDMIDRALPNTNTHTHPYHTCSLSGEHWELHLFIHLTNIY